MHLSNDLWLGASFTLNIVYLCLSLFFFLLAASRGDWFFSLYLSLSRCASRGLDFFRQNVYVSIVNLTFYRTELRLRKCFAECLGCLLLTHPYFSLNGYAFSSIRTDPLVESF